ncbi:uncharacterized protein LOC142331226 [Lycorma delicatula]|uniref:uncharacterized protein LOC142331226 n=1 Tax=Lycorma delicatula TaxID=130591 RepID=UPI003F50EDDF
MYLINNKNITITEMESVLSDVSDANNNNSSSLNPVADVSSKSYSLRPRAAVRPGVGVLDNDTTGEWRPRGRTKRRQKQKPPPLSKYRRKTANARERSRMREINEAFESLRRAIPHLTHENNHNEKMTKITTLRLAMKYIAALTQALQEPDLESDLDSAEYTLSLTPTSLSDHSLASDFSDNLLPATLAANDLPINVPADLQNHSLLPSFFSDVDPCLSLPDFNHTSYVFDDSPFTADFS